MIVCKNFLYFKLGKSKNSLDHLKNLCVSYETNLKTRKSTCYPSTFQLFITLKVDVTLWL